MHQAAEREAREETGLVVKATRLAYIEEFHNPDTRHCKFWFVADPIGGELNASAPEARQEHIVEARWLSHADLASRQVFPVFLSSKFWEDRAARVALPQYVGLREMTFW